MTIQFGFAYRQTGEMCAVHPDDPAKTLCGRTVQFLPYLRDDDHVPTNLHPRCAEVLEERRPTTAVPVRTVGTCPVCVGRAPVVDGLIGDHGQWTWVSGWRAQTSTPCSGAGQEPEDAS